MAWFRVGSVGHDRSAIAIDSDGAADRERVGGTRWFTFEMLASAVMGVTRLRKSCVQRVIREAERSGAEQSRAGVSSRSWVTILLCMCM